MLTRSSYETKNGHYTDLEVKISYKDPNTGEQSNYNWVQTVERDDKPKFVDYDYKSKSGQANYPFYQDKDENSSSRNINGYDITYYDNPDERSSNGFFKAELSLVGDPVGKQIGAQVYSPNLSNGSRIHSPVITLNYGFSVKNGSASASSIQVKQPSLFQMHVIGLIK